MRPGWFITTATPLPCDASALSLKNEGGSASPEPTPTGLSREQMGPLLDEVVRHEGCPQAGLDEHGRSNSGTIELVDIAKGLEYMRDLRIIVHGDLKGV